MRRNRECSTDEYAQQCHEWTTDGQCRHCRLPVSFASSITFCPVRSNVNTTTNRGFNTPLNSTTSSDDYYAKNTTTSSIVVL